MNSMELVRRIATGARPSSTPEKRSAPPFCTELVGPVRIAIVRARQFLLAEQRADGLWVGIQSTDARLISLLIFWLAYSGREQSELAQQCAATLFDQQTPDGGWSESSAGSIDLSASVQAYFSLKLIGLDSSSERLAQARTAIRRHGGADTADAVTRRILALFGQIDYDFCPPALPECLLFGREYRQRGPQAIIWTHRPVRNVGIERGVRELFIRQPCDWPRLESEPPRGRIGRVLQSIRARALQTRERLGWTPRRRLAIDRVKLEMAAQVGDERIKELPVDELVWHAIALRAVGFALDSDELTSCEERLRELVYIDDDLSTAAPQQAPEPRGDTALVVHSLLASGMSPNHVAIANAMDGLSELPPTATPSTTTELRGELYALQPADIPDGDQSLPPEIEVYDWFDDDGSTSLETRKHGQCTPLFSDNITQLLRRQNRDRGWGEHGHSRVGRCESEPAITGAVLEALSAHFSDDVPIAINRAITYLRSTQRADGSWIGNIAAAQIRATSSAICGLLSAGVAIDDDAIAAGVNWLIVHQQTGGGWRDSHFAEEHAARDEAAVSPTAWALLALVAAGKANHPAARRSVEYLVDTQGGDGRWTDPHFVHHAAAAGRGFRNDLHSVAWPLLALSRWAVAAISSQSEAANEVSLRLVGILAED